MRDFRFWSYGNNVADRAPPQAQPQQLNFSKISVYRWMRTRLPGTCRNRRANISLPHAVLRLKSAIIELTAIKYGSKGLSGHVALLSRSTCTVRSHRVINNSRAGRNGVTVATLLEAKTGVYVSAEM
jgi:hypothetical protein